MKARVLICDDALFMREMIGRTLVEGGYEVVGTAATGAEAVKQYEELKPDLVTMDLIMPEMGGADALREIIDSDPQRRRRNFSIKDAVRCRLKRQVPIDKCALIGNPRRELDPAVSGTGRGVCFKPIPFIQSRLWRRRRLGASAWASARYPRAA